MIRHLLTGVAVCAAITYATLTGLVSSAVAHADPPICGGPGGPPCAGPSPLAPDQQCALTAFMMHMPCNWVGQQVPQGTPGSWG
jgi:hypothetical protein